MDKLDQILSKNFDSKLPDGFSDRIRLNFRRKYYFRQRILLFSALLLIIAGLCMVFPEVASADAQFNGQPGSISSFPAMNLPLVLSQNSPAGIWQGLSDMQDAILTTFSLPAWLGLFSVGIGSVIGIGGIFPRLRTL